MPAYLHDAPPLQEALGPGLHPGGSELTRRGLSLAGAGRDELILDAGCGPGGSLRLLRAWGFKRVLGLDQDPALLARASESDGSGLIAADLARLPLCDASLDLVLCECAWSLSDRAAALAGFWRALARGGRLIISDMYSRSPAGAAARWPVKCCFAGAQAEGPTRELITNAGFRLLHWEDHSAALRQLAAELILEHGSLEAFWLAVTGDADAARCACGAGRSQLPGLFLCVAEKV